MSTGIEHTNRFGLLAAPVTVLGLWSGIYFGRAHYIVNWSWHGLDYEEVCVAIATVLSVVIAMVIWHAVPTTKRRWLMLIALPAYTTIGAVLGHISGRQLDWTNTGAIVGGMIGCMAGYFAGRAIASQSTASV